MCGLERFCIRGLVTKKNWLNLNIDSELRERGRLGGSYLVRKVWGTKMAALR